MFKLLKNVECYAPQYLGIRDILIAFGRIAMIAPDIKEGQLTFSEVVDCRGKIACPGFIDQHVHIVGGGGEQGPKSIVDPIGADKLVSAGITTVVGVLGFDGVDKSVPGLIMKARQLEHEGLSAYVYTGFYGVPTVTATGSVLNDIALINEVLGVGEIAISDYRSSCPSLQELREMSYEALTGGMLGEKAGVVHFHTGDGKSGLAPLIELLESSDFPVTMFVPTHLNRNGSLFSQSVRFHENGGMIDLTAGENTKAGRSVPECLLELLASKGGLERVTVSSDGNGSGAGDSHDGIASVMSLFNDIRSAVKDYGIPLCDALRVVTENVAKVLKLETKGKLEVGRDADILIIERDSFMQDRLYGRGRLLLEGGKPV
ncbi:MAG TPA: beta-aspartyl-peptidase [Clostridia bacterium]|nr:beta-aspartyl-peptidase [Clostridia bacterium]